mgnify:CR=1 FL=1
MTIAYLCLLIAGLLPLVATGVAKKGFKGYDNHNPRAWLAQQTGYRARAIAAEANSLEAFPFFAASLLAAIQTGVGANTVNALALVFVLARLVYLYAYVSDRASLRSAVWAVGYACVIALGVLAVRAA